MMEEIDRVVAPYTGAWIETNFFSKKVLDKRGSLLTRERGLKLQKLGDMSDTPEVAPYTGAWIETSFGDRIQAESKVAPYTGAWIET